MQKRKASCWSGIFEKWPKAQKEDIFDRSRPTQPEAAGGVIRYAAGGGGVSVSH